MKRQTSGRLDDFRHWANTIQARRPAASPVDWRSRGTLGFLLNASNFYCLGFSLTMQDFAQPFKEYWTTFAQRNRKIPPPLHFVERSRDDEMSGN
jgi:hypothetical protein